MQTSDTASDNQIQVNKCTITYEEMLDRDGKMIYRIKGVSMLPFIRQFRDIIVIVKKDPTIRCKRLDAVLFKRPNGQYVLHRILKVTPDAYWIVGDNCISGEWVREEQVLGILTEVIRNGRSVSDKNLSYRLYVRLWCAPWRLRFAILRLKNFLWRCIRWPWRHILKPMLKGRDRA